MSKWKSRKFWATIIGYGAAVVGFVYAFIFISDEVMLAALAVVGLINGEYNLANAIQARKFNGSIE